MGSGLFYPKGNPAGPSAAAVDVLSAGWQRGLPTLAGLRIVLRELRADDAPSLVALLTTDEVSRFISQPPGSIDGFERFIAWTHGQRAAGTSVSFAVLQPGSDLAIGLFQVRQIEQSFATAEWGFAIGSAFWGTGVFQESAELVLEFAFGTLGAHRIEARAAVLNGRGTGALVKIGAIREGILRNSFRRNGRPLDQGLYAILEKDWRVRRLPLISSFPVQVH